MNKRTESGVSGVGRNFLFFGFLLAASTLLLLILLIGMVLFPAYLVGLIGYYRDL